MNTLLIALGTLVAAIAYMTYKLFLLEKEVKALKKQQQQQKQQEQEQEQGAGSCGRNPFGQGVFRHHLPEADEGVHHHPLMMMPHNGPGFQTAEGGEGREFSVHMMEELMFEGSRRAASEDARPEEEGSQEDEELTSYLPLKTNPPPSPSFAEPSADAKASSIEKRHDPEGDLMIEEPGRDEGGEQPSASNASEAELVSKEPVVSVPASQPLAPEAEQQPVSMTRKRRVKASSASSASS